MKIVKFTTSRKIIFLLFLVATAWFSYTTYGMWFNFTMPVNTFGLIVCWAVRIITLCTLLGGFFMIYVFLTKPSEVLDNDKLW